LNIWRACRSLALVCATLLSDANSAKRMILSLKNILSFKNSGAKVRLSEQKTKYFFVFSSVSTFGAAKGTIKRVKSEQKRKRIKLFF
jgi:hypothetical protein